MPPSFCAVLHSQKCYKVESERVLRCETLNPVEPKVKVRIVVKALPIGIRYRRISCCLTATTFPRLFFSIILASRAEHSFSLTHLRNSLHKRFFHSVSPYNKRNFFSIYTRPHAILHSHQLH